MPKKLIILCSLAIAVLIGVNIMLEQKPQQSTATVVNKGKSHGEAEIGGAFELTNQDGIPTSDKDFLGKYMLVFFGFTNCPDVCPTDLTNISQALAALEEKKAEQVAPIFITIDPERDTPDVIKTYIASFHPSLTGLTGSAEVIEKVKDAYKVYAKKMQMDWMPEGEYMMDHSAFTYVMSPEGKYITHFTHNTDPEEMAKALKDILS